MGIIERIVKWNTERRWKREHNEFKELHAKLRPVFDALSQITPEELEKYAVYQGKAASSEHLVQSERTSQLLWCDARFAFSLLWARQVVTDIQNAQLTTKKVRITYVYEN